MEALNKKQVSIEVASVHDVAEISELLLAQLSEHRISISRSDLTTAIEGVFAQTGRGFFLLAIIDDACIGVAYVSLVWALEHGGQSAWLEELYVRPDYRIEGIGTDLLQAVLAECKDLGCAAVDLEIDADHERVRSLYERNGFTSLPRKRMVKILSTKKIE